MRGENILQTLQKIMTVTLRLDELSKEVDELEDDVRSELGEHDERIRALEVAVGRLEEARATQRETVRAEIATAIAELRVRFVEEQAQRRQEPPALQGNE